MKAVRILYHAESLPIFQNRVYGSELEAKASPTGDIRLVEDLRTGLVYNDAFRPEVMEYDSSYNNEQAVSPFFRRHLQAVSQIIARHIGRKGIVEVGCGKGYFLEMLVADGFDITGFDPTYDGTNSRITKAYFHPGRSARCEGFVLRHVLEHIQNPVEFLLKLRETNEGSGKIYIEVPCFDWICERRAWFDIFYEHVNYFRLSDFRRMFGVLHAADRSFGGQYLSVVADLRSLRGPEFDPNDPVRFPSDFTRSLKPRTLEQSAIWGGASKGVVFALLMERAGAKPELVIDINPAKQGKHLPGTGLKISSPAEALKRLKGGATVYVMNSNYLAEIRDMSQNRFAYVMVDE
jgi:hypothetical protein